MSHIEEWIRLRQIVGDDCLLYVAEHGFRCQHCQNQEKCGSYSSIKMCKTGQDKIGLLFILSKSCITEFKPIKEKR
jgi:hypothetical protein